MSRYENYEIKNNVFGVLSAPISSLTTTIQLEEWQWARFSTNMLATLENIESWKVLHREIVLVTAINWDVLTVTRKVAPCPTSDDDNSQWQVSYAFGAGDTISAYIDKEHFDKIDDSINDIYDNWVNKLRTEVISWLQIKVNEWPVLVGSAYYDFAGDTITLTDNATNYVEIDEDGLLVSNTTDWWDKHTKIAKVITSSGAITSIEDWRLGTVWGEIWWVNIHDLTEKEILNNNDEFIVADSENIFQNKKVKASNIWKTLIQNWIAWENINKWDSIYNSYITSSSDVNNFCNIGDTAENTKIWINAFGNWISWNTVKIKLLPTSNNVWDLSLRIETDNNWEPSWILIDENAYWSISYSWGWFIKAIVDASVISESDYSSRFWIERCNWICMSKDWIHFLESYYYSNTSILRCYTLSTPFDLSTATLTSNVTVSGSAIWTVWSNDDWTKIYVKDGTSSNWLIYIYTMTPENARSLNNATVSNKQWLGSSYPNMKFWDNWKKLYYTRWNYIYQCDLWTPWDLDTCWPFKQSASFPVGWSSMDFGFINEWKTIILNNSTNDWVQYDLITARDITSINMTEYKSCRMSGNYFNSNYNDTYIITAATNYIYAYNAWQYLSKDVDIILNNDVSYSWFIRVVLSADINNLEYWKIWFNNNIIKTPSKRYDWNIWKDVFINVNWNNVMVSGTPQNNVGMINTRHWYDFIVYKKSKLIKTWLVDSASSSNPMKLYLHDNWTLIELMQCTDYTWWYANFNYTLEPWKYRIDWYYNATWYQKIFNNYKLYKDDIIEFTNPVYASSTTTLTQHTFKYFEFEEIWWDIFINSTLIYDCLLKKTSAQHQYELPDFPMIAKTSWNLWDKISYDYFWITDIKKWLIPKKTYYISDNYWEISITPGTIWFVFWTAQEWWDKLWLWLLNYPLWALFDIWRKRTISISPSSAWFIEFNDDEKIILLNMYQNGKIKSIFKLLDRDRSETFNNNEIKYNTSIRELSYVWNISYDICIY